MAADAPVLDFGGGGSSHGFSNVYHGQGIPTNGLFTLSVSDSNSIWTLTLKRKGARNPYTSVEADADTECAQYQ